MAKPEQEAVPERGPHRVERQRGRVVGQGEVVHAGPERRQPLERGVHDRQHGQDHGHAEVREAEPQERPPEAADVHDARAEGLARDGGVAAPAHDAAVDPHHREHQREQRHAHGRRRREPRRVLRHHLVHRRGDDVEAAGEAEDQRRRERAQHLGEDEDGGAEHAGQHERQRDPEHRPHAAGAEDLRGLLERGVHRLHHGADHHEGDRALEEGHHPGDPPGRVDVDQVAPAAERPPELVDEAAVGRADERPGQRAHERRHVVGHGHELLEGGPAGDVRARQDPPHRESHHDGQDGRDGRHQERVAEDVRVAAEVGEVVEPVRLRRARLRIAHAQGRLDQVGDRIEDEDGGPAPDDQADEARARPPGPGPRDEGHDAGLRAP